MVMSFFTSKERKRRLGNISQRGKRDRRAAWRVPSAVIAVLVLLSVSGAFSPVLLASVSNVASLVGEIESLNTELARTNKEYETIQADLAVFNMRADEARVLLEKTRKKLGRQKKQFNDRLVAMYKSGRISGIERLLGSADLLDFIDREAWSEDIAMEDARLVEDMKVTTAIVGQQERDIADRRRAQQSKFNWAVARKCDLEAKLTDCRNKLTSIDPIVARLTEQPQTELSHRINSYLARKQSPLTGYGIVFVLAEQRTGVSAKLLIGLAEAESSLATAGVLYGTNHNAWGMKGPQPLIAGGIPAAGGYCTWQNWEIAIQQAADFVNHYWGPAQTASQLSGYCETGGAGSDWEKRVEGSRNSI
jgi:hypothetical protein